MKNAQIMYIHPSAAGSKFINQLVMKEYLNRNQFIAQLK